ncbi:MAG: hypothetical protein LBQ32_04350, partial [Burkholderiaceae bacterium]|nr:hypothetical protein [Burkholderiaceae bacterium]
MPTRTGTARVVTTTSKYKDKVYRTHLLRRSYREDGKVKNETLGNLSHLSDSVIDRIRRSLQRVSQKSCKRAPQREQRACVEKTTSQNRAGAIFSSMGGGRR